MVAGLRPLGGEGCGGAAFVEEALFVGAVGRHDCLCRGAMEKWRCVVSVVKWFGMGWDG